MMSDLDWTTSIKERAGAASFEGELTELRDEQQMFASMAIGIEGR